ncbi:class I SAM-dependent methyltransferase, partial [Mangrovimonas sp. TPBH4]|uniref:class I SAM-dependent methyltransferase n=1 Tax=Mangrovimonas sp. TPBH4 TaxID=1645914 RepID=UPI0006B4CD0C
MIIKKIIKKIIPTKLKNRLNDFRISNISNCKPIEETFTNIYKTNYWDSKESLSGGGSEKVHTRFLVKELEIVLKQFQIKSMLDIPCGDFNWMQVLDFKRINYTGADIVSDLIELNRINYSEENKKFINLDLTKDKLPKVDLIFCRDCLVHLSNHNIYKALINIKQSNSKYLLTTSFLNLDKNKNIVTGGWRKLNFQKPPFNFSKPMYFIDEKCMEKGGLYLDKSMCLWEVNKIKIPL